MLAYYILCLLPLVVCGLEQNHGIVIKMNDDRKTTNALGLSFFFFILTLLLALRSIDCGVDLKNYKYYFNSYGNMSFRELVDVNRNYDVEIGFRLFVKVLQVVSNDFQWFIAATAVLSVLPIWWLYKKNNAASALTIVLFLSVAPFSLYFSGIRQVLAMAFAVPAYQFSKKRKKTGFILSVLLATLFHQSAFIMLLLYPVYRAKITKKWLYAVVPFMIVVYVFNEPIFNWLLRFLVGTRYETYTMARTGAYGMLLLLAAFSAIAIFVTSDSDKALSDEIIGQRNILLLSTCLQFFVPLSTVAMRMNYYYMIFIPMIIPKLLNSSSKRHWDAARLIYVVMTMFFLANFIKSMYTSADILQVFPYIPFWQE
ncbi:EpsG family protein [uncultured Dysosmobacter sp.]|uniref:EpsG family protein n=1 Tax=uncultured Dysosmobacter sp. TaxID=2591384 RepID=UPI0026319E6C|nr:EpsG family protein [uncultured Dysosmobacter sp.]